MSESRLSLSKKIGGEDANMKSLSKFERLLFGVIAFLLWMTLVKEARADLTASFGVSVAGVQVVATRRLAVSATATVEVVGLHGFTLGLRDELSLMPALGGADMYPSVHNRTVASVGYSWPSFTLSLGLGLAEYQMSACNAAGCRRATGAAPNADLVATYYTDWVDGMFGIRAAMWGGLYFGDSKVFTGGAPVISVTLGPVLRIGGRR